MTTVACLGFDPGPSKCGWAVVHSQGGTARPTFVAGGIVMSASPSLNTLIWGEQSMYRSALVVAIETVSGYAHEHKRSAALHATAHVAGIIEGIAASDRVPVRRVPATDWRRCVVGRGNASDAEIRRALSVLVANFPKRSSVHVRDAMGCAFAALQTRRVAA